MSRSPSEPPAHERPPHEHPGVEVIEELGGGATGRVWRARLLEPLELPGTGELLEAGAEVALKRLLPSAARQPDQRAAFELESRLARSSRHPAVVRGLACGEDEEGPWLMLELLGGPTLRQVLEREGALQEPRVRAVAARLCGGLVELHGAGYLHGDLKPENVRLDGAGQAVLIDLGFCVPVGGEAERRSTGSLAYLSPEELRGGAKSAASEVYSLGILLYELAVGRHPFASTYRAQADAGRVEALAAATFDPPSLRVPTLSPFLDDLLQEMLQATSDWRPALRGLGELFSAGEGSAWWRAQVSGRAQPLPPAPYLYAHQALPLVGREAELEALLGVARGVFGARPAKSGKGGSAQRGAFVELSGSGGSGKSRLMREFAARARRSEWPPIYLRGRCSRFEEQRPCQPWIALLSRFLDLRGGEVPGPRAGQRLEGLLPTSERETLLEVLDPLYDRVTPAAVPVALCNWLLGLARRGPLLLFVDDLTFADEGTLDVLARLVLELEQLPLMIVVGRDSEEWPRRPDAHRRMQERLRALEARSEVVLPPLSAEALEELTRRLFTRTSPQLEVQSQQVAQAPGERDHPLPQRDLGQDVDHQMRRRLGHPTPPTGGAEAAPFAREGHREVCAAGEAVEAAEAVGQDAAGEVASELALDVGWQTGAGGVRLGAGQEGLEVLE